MAECVRHLSWDVEVERPTTCDREELVTTADRELVVKVDIRCPVVLSCARCLEEFHSTIRTDAVFSYNVQPTDIIDITDDVRQEIVLAYPMIPVCRSECKGLCSACGQNLNLAACSHDAPERRSR